MGGTRGLGIMSSAADVLWINVLRGMRGVGGVCEMCMCLARAVWVKRGVSGGEDWVWALPILWEQGSVGRVCVLVVVVWVGAWTKVWRGGVVLCLCEL